MQNPKLYSGYFIVVLFLGVVIINLININNLIRSEREQVEAGLNVQNKELIRELDKVQKEKLELEKKVKVLSQKAVEKREVARGVGSVIVATVTGYNSVPEQTDSTPCVASGGYICGRDDVVACPTYLALGSWVTIEGKSYQCMDRTHPRYGSRFDIFCDKDFTCPREVSGTKKIFISKV